MLGESVGEYPNSGRGIRRFKIERGVCIFLFVLLMLQYFADFSAES